MLSCHATSAQRETVFDEVQCVLRMLLVALTNCAMYEHSMTLVEPMNVTAVQQPFI
jgi:hypothetical protein